MVNAGITRRGFVAGLTAALTAGSLPGLALGADASLPAVRYVATNGIRMAVYEAGAGFPVVLLHGFPELAFSWRHQIPALAAAGYRVIAPDMRGYGLTDRPARAEDYDMAHLTGDLAGLLDALGLEKAVFAGHDWGGLVAWQMPLLHKDRTAGVIGINTPFVPHEMLWLQPDLIKDLAPAGTRFEPTPSTDPIEQMRAIYGPDMYVMVFEDGDAADRLLARDVERTFRTIMRRGAITAAAYAKLPPAARHMALFKPLDGPAPATLPGELILTPHELAFYVESFRRTGFTPGINWYRNLSRNWRAGAAVDQTVRVPALMIGAEDDVVLTPALMDGMEAHVPDLEKHVIAACGHWTQQEKPAKVNRLLVDWLHRRFPV